MDGGKNEAVTICVQKIPKIEKKRGRGPRRESRQVQMYWRQEVI